MKWSMNTHGPPFAHTLMSTRLFALACMTVSLAGCDRGSVEPEPELVTSTYVIGPGCSVTAMYELGDGMLELAVHRFDHCVSVVWDSTLAGANAKGSVKGQRR